MLIKLKCKACHYDYEITEDELYDKGQYHKFCFRCGGENEVINLGEILDKDIDTQIKQYIDKGFKKHGIEGTIEIIERNSNQACYRLYKEELERRGFKLK